MKILKIEFENLNSLRGVQTIDLESGDLAEAGIFAITGPTGAGKSTILDAITLALYGRAARYGSSPSPENMMSRHTGHCRSEIVFETPEGRFRSAWSLNRARKKPDGKPQPAKHQVFDQNETPLTQKIKETAGKIEELIGLDFDRFLRSVLLAQGEFAKFLKSDVNERSRLLESLTGTGIYSELSQLVYEQHKDRESQLKQREVKLNAVVLLSDDELKQKHSQRQALETELKSFTKKLSTTRKRVELGNQFQETTSAKKKRTTELKSLEERSKAQAADEQRLKSHRKAFAFKADLGRLDQLKIQCFESEKMARQAVEQTQTSGQAFKLSLRHATEWLTDRSSKLQSKLTAEAERQEKLTAEQTKVSDWLKANEADQRLTLVIPNLRTGLEKLNSGWQSEQESATQLKKLAAEIKKNETATLKAKEDLKSVESTIKKDQAALTQEQDRLASALNGADPKTLQDQRDHLNEQIASVTVMGEQQSDANALELDIKEKRKSLETQREEAKQQEQTLDQAVKAVKSQEEINAALEIAVEQARLVADLTDHRANLTDGEPCPLCGALDHPAVDGEPPSSFASVQKKHNAAKKKLSDLQTKQQTLSERQTRANEKLKSTQQEILKEEKRLEKIQDTLATRADDLSLSQQEAKDLIATKAAFEKRLNQFKRQMEQIDGLRESVQKCEKTVQESTGQLNLHTQSLDSLQTQLADLQARDRETAQRLEQANIDVQNQIRQLNELLEPFELSIPNAKSIDSFQESLDQRSQAFQAQTEKLTKLESQLTGSQQVAKDLLREQKEAENELSRVNTWAKEETLHAVGLPAAADTKKETQWSNAADLMDDLTTLRTAWQQTTNRERDRKEAASVNQQTFKSMTTAFLAKAVQGGFESVDQLHATLLSEEAAKKIADGLDQHKEKLNKTLGQLEELETALSLLLEKSAPNEKQLTELVAEVEQAEADAGLKQKELAAIESVLETDAKQRKTQEQAHKELQDERQQLATWQRMNEIMGSADGKKFRTFAQGISLDLVIRQANEHLTELSKRYRLQRRAADSLGLEICDLHQANALRPMESLSGGESFVVSLALALGLSDLAGQSVRIDSLFIDEGFGTLDPETLDMAVAALERLQARNKTIGVISHVELLKERITTQIQVQPTAGGVSELKIVA